MGGQTKSKRKRKKHWAKRQEEAISLEVKETKHREKTKLEHAKRRGVSMPTTLLQIIETKRKKCRELKIS